jgi:hypothetical protein
MSVSPVRCGEVTANRFTYANEMCHNSRKGVFGLTSRSLAWSTKLESVTQSPSMGDCFGVDAVPAASDPMTVASAITFGKGRVNRSIDVLVMWVIGVTRQRPLSDMAGESRSA